MKRRIAVACGLAMMMAGLTACGAARPSKFYSLDIPESSSPASAPRFQTDLLVGRIIAPQLYRDDRIVYRTNSTQLGAYEYHRWAEPPAVTIENLLLRVLRYSGSYRSVQSLASNAHGDYILRGRLHELDEITGSNLVARVDFEVELYSRKDGTVVWSNHYNQDEPVTGRHVSDVVDAMNRNLRRAIDQISTGLAAYFTQHPPKD